MAITIQEMLTKLNQGLSQHTETPSLDAQVLVAHFIEKSRSWVLAHPEVILSHQQYDQLDHALNRLQRGEPLPYVIEHWEFFGLDFHLTPDVLIPRPETELLVERSLDWLNQHPHRRKAIDVGTGSGCIGITLAKHIPDLNVLLTDISIPALYVARLNAEKHGLTDRLEFQQADLLDGVTALFDLICANLPYIPAHVLRRLPVSKSEPNQALDGGTSGVELITRLLDQAVSKLACGGLMLLEIESSQGTIVKSLAQAFFPAAMVQILHDLSGLDRCVEVRSSNLIVHLCQYQEWLKAQEIDNYQNKSLSREGFIHCSQPAQILKVANRFYREIPDLVLLWIDPDKITSEIRWETADSEVFPHIYGPINLAAVISVTELKPAIDGYFRLVQTPG